jgi:hypothetical protein
MSGHDPRLREPQVRCGQPGLSPFGQLDHGTTDGSGVPATVGGSPAGDG